MHEFHDLGGLPAHILQVLPNCSLVKALVQDTVSRRPSSPQIRPFLHPSVPPPEAQLLGHEPYPCPVTDRDHPTGLHAFPQIPHDLVCRFFGSDRGAWVSQSEILSEPENLTQLQRQREHFPNQPQCFEESNATKQQTRVLIGVDD